MIDDSVVGQLTRKIQTPFKCVFFVFVCVFMLASQHACMLFACPNIYFYCLFACVFICTCLVCVYLCCLVCVVCVHDSQRQMCPSFCFSVILSVCRVIAIMQVSMYVLAGVRVCLSRYICLFHHTQGFSSYGTLEVHMG